MTIYSKRECQAGQIIYIDGLRLTRRKALNVLRESLVGGKVKKPFKCQLHSRAKTCEVCIQIKGNLSSVLSEANRRVL